MPVLPGIIGIYAIYSACNDKIYVGYSGGITERWANHRTKLHGGRHENKHLQRAWNKYGADAFAFSVLEECAEELLIEREQFHMDQYPKKNRYNILDSAGSARGYKHTDEAKAKISTAHKGKVVSSETRKRISISKTGLKATDEHRANISASNMGREVSPETRARLSEALIGNTNGAGRTMSSEAREKISVAQKARWARWRAERLETEMTDEEPTILAAIVCVPDRPGS